MTWEQFLSQEHLTKLGISLGIILLFVLLHRLFTKYVLRLLRRLSKKINSQFLPNVFDAFERPLHWLFIIIGIYLAIIYYPYFDHTQVLFIKILKSIFVIIVMWGLVNLVSSSSYLFQFINEKSNIHLDEILIPFLSRIFQFVIVMIAISIVLQEFDYQIGGLITGLGLGGLAVSLAAQDALKNLFGGIVIVMEKPFTIGEWISTPSVEGVVEDISFRSTKVRTFEQALVTVPNATLVNEAIMNWSKMGKRRINLSIPVPLNTPSDTLTVVVKEIEQLLTNYDEIHDETIIVNVNAFDESGIHIFIYCFTKTTGYEAHLKVREQVHLQILDILAKYNIEVGKPSRTLYVNEETLPNDKKENE